MSDPSKAVSIVRDEMRPLTMAERMSPAMLALDVWTSLPATPEGVADTIRHMGGSDADSIGGVINTTIPVEHVLVHRVDIRVDAVIDKSTGEVLVPESTKVADRCVLIGPDGEAIAATSEGIRKSLQTLIGFYGLPPWSPPLRVKVEQIETRAGRRTFNLVPVVESKKEKPNK